MIIGFIGCPCSGKTTTAASLFAKLKEYALRTEFVVEQARWYIAEKRHKEKLPISSGVSLEDYDQLQIMRQQYYAETVMEPSVGEGGVLVCDSSVLNSLLYMKPESRDFEDVKEIATKAAARYDLLFHCPPIAPLVSDPNRIHTHSQSVEINRTIPQVLAPYLSNQTLHTLNGNTDERCGLALRRILEAFRDARNS